MKMQSIMKNLDYSYLIQLLNGRLLKLEQEKYICQLTTCTFNCKKNNINIINKEIDFIKEEIKKIQILQQFSNKNY